MIVYYNGAAAGQSDYVCRADGSFDASSKLALGPATLDSKVSGHFSKDGHLIDYTFEQTSMKRTVKLNLAKGKLHASVPGRDDVDLPFDASKITTFAGNLIPAFNQSLLSKVKWENKSEQTISAYGIDIGSLIPIKVKPGEEKKISRGTVRTYNVQIGTVSIAYTTDSEGHVVGMDVPGQHLRFLEEGWNDLYEDPFAKYPELSQATYEVKKLPAQIMRTRDGVELVQDVFVPDKPGKYPVVFSRTPYDRRTESINATFYVRRGYAYVAQDCRGRTDSKGEWDPFIHEQEDGYDAVNWIAHQPWCDGNVGMIGASYGGFVQWAAASLRPAALKCIVPQVSPPLDAMRNLPYDYGTFFLYGDVWWGKIVLGKNADMSTILSSLPNPQGFSKLPLSKVDDAVLGHDVPFYNRWLDRTRLSDWKGWNFYDKLPAMDIPVLSISGWWDGDEIGTNLNWDEMQRLGKRNQWVIYGPWTHFFNSSSRYADQDYGVRATLDLDTLYIRWFDTWLKGKDVGMNKVPHVQAFVTGLNKWLTFDRWPAASATRRTLYLDSAQYEKAGRLTTSPVKGSGTYVYEPAKDKVPDEYSHLNPAKASTKVVVKKATKHGLLFQSAPLSRPMAIAGNIEVELCFKTSARDTDFFVNFVDVSPDGESHVFGSPGKIRASYHAGLDKPRSLTPNQVYTVKLRPWDTAHELPAGHRLGLVLSSSAFPVYARNLGTGEPIKNATRMVDQKNTILYGPKLSRVSFYTLWD